jgi:hypothetical protein
VKLIIECKPGQRLADLANVKLALLELGYQITITPAGDLLARDPQPAPCGDLIAIDRPRHKPVWPPRKLRAAP